MRPQRDPAVHIYEHGSEKFTKTELLRALAAKEFFLTYQPIVDTHTSLIVGAEALLRWQHPEHGLIMPSDFIPAAEESGAIVAIGSWVMFTALRQTHRWRQRYEHLSDLWISINVSGQQVLDGDLLEVIAEAIKRTGMCPEAIRLELTESRVLDESAEIDELMERIRSLGPSFSLDDFGTGYSSLSYVRRFLVSSIKIDKSFVSNLNDASREFRILEGIIKFAHSLDINVITEGIETYQQSRIIQSLDCDFGQGYFWSKALTVDEFEARVVAENVALAS